MDILKDSPLWMQIQDLFKDKEKFTLKEAYEAIPDKPATTIRGRIYDKLGIAFEKIDSDKAIYRVKKDNCSCVIIEGDGRDLSIIEDNSIDTIITDFAWEDKKSNKGGNRNFATYETFEYTLEDFKEKARVLKPGSFLVEILPAENENNYDMLYNIKKMAEEAGFLYYSKVTWKKGSFVSNTGRKAKNSEDVMIFSLGKARDLRVDAKKTKATNIECYMSGTNKMLPTMFDVQAVPVKDRISESEKPVELYEQIIDFVCKEGEVILDQFAGSGALGVASIKTRRNCILIEIVKEKVLKIKERIKEFGDIVEEVKFNTLLTY